MKSRITYILTTEILLISGISHAQDGDTVIIHKEGIHNNFMEYHTSYNYEWKDSIVGTIIYGNVNKETMVAHGKWVFLEDEGDVLRGKYKNGLKQGKWRHTSGGYTVYRKGIVRRAKLIY